MRMYTKGDENSDFLIVIRIVICFIECKEKSLDIFTLFNVYYNCHCMYFLLTFISLFIYNILIYIIFYWL